MYPTIIVPAMLASVLMAQTSAGATTHSFFADRELESTHRASSMTMLQEQSTTRAIRSFGAQDTWRWTLQGAYGHDVNDGEDNLGLLGAGLTYFLIDDLSVNFELNAMYFDQDENNAFGGNFNLLFRWHFYAQENWSLYVDGGAGMLLASEEVPDRGSNFNFTPQAGLGASFDLNESSRVLTGVRWHHMSNARLYDENPGRDSVQVYAQLSFPF